MAKIPASRRTGKRSKAKAAPAESRAGRLLRQLDGIKKHLVEAPRRTLTSLYYASFMPDAAHGDLLRALGLRLALDPSRPVEGNLWLYKTTRDATGWVIQRAENAFFANHGPLDGSKKEVRLRDTVAVLDCVLGTERHLERLRLLVKQLHGGEPPRTDCWPDVLEALECKKGPPESPQPRAEIHCAVVGQNGYLWDGNAGSGSTVSIKLQLNHLEILLGYFDGAGRPLEAQPSPAQLLPRYSGKDAAGRIRRAFTAIRQRARQALEGVSSPGALSHLLHAGASRESEAGRVRQFPFLLLKKDPPTFLREAGQGDARLR